MSDWYILDGRTPVKANLETAVGIFDTDRRVALTTVGDMEVSTVFLALDHQFFPGGPPLLFETMVFPDYDPTRDWGTERYSTWEEAEAGHRAMVERCWRRVGC